MEIELTNVGLTLPGNHRAIERVNLRIAEGERVAVIGPSGAGKTSLLRLVGTALRSGEGRLHLDGVDPWRLPRRALRRLRARIGTIHQAPPLPPRQRVVTAVLAGRLGQWPLWKSLASLAYPLDVAGARRALARLDLAERLFDRCDRLSGGQLQRVGAARVLYQQPALLLADEPVSALDPQLADLTVGELNRDAIERGATLVASLHAVDLALRWFPRVVGLRSGGIAFDLPPVRVTEAMLRALYASESASPPTQAPRPLTLEAAGPRPAVASDPPCR
ncbi:MAG: phosphonate ABC transporter ATP-binding protein [Pseudomonadota bacterium]